MHLCRKISIAIAAAGLLCCNSVWSETKSSAWEPWRPLVGQWEATGKGNPGQSQGQFSFAFDLQDKILVRKSHSDYPTAAGRPAFSHDDLMVIYPDGETGKFRADYYDNEGHVIRYTTSWSADSKTVTFLSDSVPAQPRFRLSYVRNADGNLDIKFEIAPPNAPDKFETYVEGSTRKR